MPRVQECLGGRVGHVEPVAQEGVLELGDGGAADLEVVVNRAGLAFAFQVNVVEVDPADEADCAVDDEYFPVVA